MMTLNDVIELIGKQEYSQLVVAAHRVASDTGKRGAAGLNSDVIHEICTLIWWDNDAMTPDQKARLTLQIYEDVPCYVLLMYVKTHYKDFDIQTRGFVWGKFRDWLSADDDALAGPAGYSLWVDFFEDPGTVEEAWQSLVPDSVAEKLLQRVLIYSGPVPFRLKVTYMSR